jgi:basic amino acid/polyamine antiporter, APA family
MMGLGSIIGTGVFVSLGIAAGIAGPAVIIAVAIAAAVATCNALSSAQLAASHPVSGGTYEYGYRYLNPLAGFSAGWLFLCAKSASAATAALGFAGYLLSTLASAGLPVAPADRLILTAIAVATIVALTVIILGGIRRTSGVNIAIVSVTLAALAIFVVAGIPRAISQGEANLTSFAGTDAAAGFWPAILHASALMFVAYTGYGRIATMGEEVAEPRRTIPRAIIITLVVSALLYIAASAIAIATMGAGPLGEVTRERAAPLEVAARGFGIPGIHHLIAIGAMTAMLGVLLNLILGLSRVLLAMGRRGDMPAATARITAPGTPVVAIVVTGAVTTPLALTGSVRLTWSFSAFTVLLYYAITNLAALALPREQRLYPRWIALAGLIACLGLAFFVERQIWAAGLALVAAGLLWRALVRSSGRGSGRTDASM